MQDFWSTQTQMGLPQNCRDIQTFTSKLFYSTKEKKIHKRAGVLQKEIGFFHITSTFQFKQQWDFRKARNRSREQDLMIVVKS